MASALPAEGAAVVYVADGDVQNGPFTLQAVLESITAGQRAPDVRVWWDGLEGWAPINSHPELHQWFGAHSAAAAQPAHSQPAHPQPAAPPPAFDGPEADSLEALFTEMIQESWAYYKRVDYANRLDEVLVGALITSTLDAGSVLIDLTSDGREHFLRFEDPSDGSRITMGMKHLTPSAVDGEVLGHHASIVIGWGQRVANARQVVSALKEELKGSLVQTPEPGTVTVDGDIASGYAYTQIDLIWGIDDLVSPTYDVDVEKLTVRIRAAVHSLRKYWHGRFAPAS